MAISQLVGVGVEQPASDDEPRERFKRSPWKKAQNSLKNSNNCFIRIPRVTHSVDQNIISFSSFFLTCVSSLGYLFLHFLSPLSNTTTCRLWQMLLPESAAAASGQQRLSLMFQHLRCALRRLHGLFPERVTQQIRCDIPWCVGACERR